MKTYNTGVSSFVSADAAIEWANGACLHELESDEVPREVRTDTWNRVGEADGGCVVVWEDPTGDYIFEDCYPEGEQSK